MWLVNREALWQVQRMYDVDGKLLNGIKSKYVDSKSELELLVQER